MRQTLFAAAIAALAAMPLSQARAIVFPGGTSDGQFIVAVAGVLIALQLPAIQEARAASARGSITLGRRQVEDNFFPEETLVPGGRAGIFSPDVLDFDLILDFPTDADNGRASVRLTPDTGAIEVINPGWYTDGQDLFIDSTGLAPGTPILSLTVDTFDDVIGFPDGRRLGDDTQDLLLFQMFTGSVNLGVAALPDGFAGPPAVLGIQQLATGNLYTFGSLDSAVAVPAPASLPLLLGGLGILWARRRRAHDVGGIYTRAAAITAP